MYSFFDFPRKKPAFPIKNFLLISLEVMIFFPTVFIKVILFTIVIFDRFFVFIWSRFERLFKVTEVDSFTVTTFYFIKLLFLSSLATWSFDFHLRKVFQCKNWILFCEFWVYVLVSHWCFKRKVNTNSDFFFDICDWCFLIWLSQAVLVRNSLKDFTDDTFLISIVLKHIFFFV